MSRSVWLLVVIVGTGLFLRGYKFESRLSFDFDNEFFAWEAKKILVDRKPTLVGQESSVMGVFIAPLYTYLSTLFYAAWRMDPIAGGVLAIFLGIVATVVMYRSAGLLAAIFYQWLMFGITWDWSASALNGMFIVPGLWLYAILRGWWWLNLIAVGLAWHLHPTAIILTVATAVLLWLNRRNVSRRDLVWGGAGVAILLSPLLLFELRHGWVMSRSLWAARLLTSGETTGVVTASRIFLNGLGGWLYGPHYATAYRWVAGVVALLFWGWLKTRGNLGRFWQAYLVLLGTTWLALALYSRHVTDYYPMVVYGPTMVATAVALRRLPRWVVAGMMVWLIAINWRAWSAFTRPYNLQAKKQVIDWVIDHAAGRKFNISDSFISPGHNTGYSYLLWRRGASLEKQSPEIIYSLVIPSWYKEIVPKVEIGGIGIEWGEVLR